MQFLRNSIKRKRSKIELAGPHSENEVGTMWYDGTDMQKVWRDYRKAEKSGKYRNRRK